MEKLKYRFTRRLTEREIVDIIDTFRRESLPEIQLKNDYAKGNNTFILNRLIPSNSPQNKVPVPYARRIVSIISSYMFLPGLISYASEDETYLQGLQDIFKANRRTKSH